MELAIIIDVVILLLIVYGALNGFKNGVIKTSMRFIGLFIVIIISFILKDRLMILLYENLPFFDFFGLIEGIDSISILVYQLVAFGIVFFLLMLVLRVLVAVTGIIEWLLKKMVFIGIPSKILGFFVGAVEYYVYVFIGLYIFSIPLFGITAIEESRLGKYILHDTPILSEMVDNTVEVYSKVWNVISNRGDLTGPEINTFVLATLLDNDLITITSAKELVRANYIKIKDPTILDKYGADDSFFETIGGCVLIGGCDEGNSVVRVIDSKVIYTDGVKFTIDDISVRVAYLGFNDCISKGTCDKNERIEVGLVVNNKYEDIEMVAVTGDKYKWIIDTDNYIFARIDDGKLVVGVAEYIGRWNKYDN